MAIIVKIVKLPNAGHFEEFDALVNEPGVQTTFIESPDQLGRPDLIVLPGTEKTIPDLEWLRDTGMEASLRDAMSTGALLFGICGGFQMMGRELRDPEHLEGAAEQAEGLRLFDLDTTFTRDGINEPVRASAAGGFLPAGTRVVGFEEHGGRSVLRDGGDAVSLFEQDALGGGSCPLGVATKDLAVMGTYLHGVLSDPAFRRALLDHVRARKKMR